MESSATDDAVSIEIPGWEANASGYVLSVEAEAMARHSQDIRHPPQLIFHFLLQTISPSTYAAELAYFAIHEPYQNIIYEAAWEEETRWMLSHVAAEHMRIDDLALLVLAFRRYTKMVLDLFPIMELSAMEFYSVIEIPPTAPFTSTSQLRYFIPMETRQYFFEEEEEDDDDDEPIGRITSTAAMIEERVRVKIVEEADTCSICLDDFDAMTHVLEMPCRHIFHNECLREWLTRSQTCPLCRFTLLPDADAK